MVGRGRLKCRDNFGCRRGRGFEGFCVAPPAGCTPSGMTLCNNTLSSTVANVSGFVVGGIREGISAPASLCERFSSDFQLLAAAGDVMSGRPSVRVRPPSPSRSCLSVVSLAGPTRSARSSARQSVKLPSSMIAVNCFPFAIVCLSLSLSISTSAISLNPRLPVTTRPRPIISYPPSGRRWKRPIATV